MLAVGREYKYIGNSKTYAHGIAICDPIFVCTKIASKGSRFECGYFNVKFRSIEMEEQWQFIKEGFTLEGKCFEPILIPRKVKISELV